MSIFIIGPTGVGKTTLANRLAEKFALRRVSASEWARRAFGPPTDCAGDAVRYVEALTEFSRRALRADPQVCVRFVRSSYDVDGGALVIEGVRNPHDFHQLFRPERDVAVILWPARAEWATDFERDGVMMIAESLRWLVAQKIMDEARLIFRIAGTGPAAMEVVAAAVLASPVVAASVRSCEPAKGGGAVVHRQISPISVRVAEEFLYDQDPARRGRRVPGRIFAVSSYRGHLPTFQLLLEGGAVFSYLPAHALWHRDPAGEPVEPSALVYHPCPEYECSVHEFAALRGPVDAFFPGAGRWVGGSYLFTLEWHTANDVLHALALDTGQIALLPQHKIRFGGGRAALPAYKKLRAAWHASVPGEWDNVRAACVVVRRDGRVLCIARDDGLGLGLPGGGVEAGERPDEAAARELREETGLEVAAADLELLYDGPSDDGLRVQTFLARAARGEPRPSEEGLVFFGPAADLLTSAGAYPRYNAEVLRRLSY